MTIEKIIQTLFLSPSESTKICIDAIGAGGTRAAAAAAEAHLVRRVLLPHEDYVLGRFLQNLSSATEQEWRI